MADVKRARAMQKNHVDYFKNAKIFSDGNLATARRNQIKLRLEEMIDIRARFLSNQATLEALDEKELESDIRSVIDNYYYELRPLLEDRLDELKDMKKEATGTVPAEDMGLIPKLPELKLEIFSGEVKQWPSFIASFNSHVHGNPKLKTITKFQFLRNAVTGAAAKVIENLDFSVENYAEALHLLEQRYDKPHVIAEDHIRALFKIKPIERGTSQKILSLLDEVNSHLRSLKSLKRPTEYWDDLIVHLLVSKLDAETKNKWCEEAPQNAMPTLADITKFLTIRSHMLQGQRNETANAGTMNTNAASSGRALGFRPNPASSRIRAPTALHTYQFYCVNCKQDGHSIIRCHQFLALSVDDRIKKAKTEKLCLNCLKPSHFVSNCSSRDVCRLCQSRHHTLIHQHSSSAPIKPQATATVAGISSDGVDSSATAHGSSASLFACSSFGENESSFSLTASQTRSNYVFLATAQVLVSNNCNKTLLVRALLDSGSQLNFISKSLLSKLGMHPAKKQLNISGIGGNLTTSIGSVVINMMSRNSTFSSDLEVHVLPRITSDQPSTSFVRENLGIPRDLELADPWFHETREIDLLIGNDLVYAINLDGRMHLENGITLQNTVLGWIVAGRCKAELMGNAYPVSAISLLNRQLERFWHIDEELTQAKPQEDEQNACEQHFIETHQRDKLGRFVLKLPFLKATTLLGDSSKIAMRRFLNLEKQLDRDATRRQSYCDFMDEYIRLGHMERVNVISNANFYLPHFAVTNFDSTSTRLRVVFDGSAKTSSGISLNQILIVGPIIQHDLASVLLRFRAYSYVMSADIVKMYRQYWVHPDDRCYQYIYWRFNSNEPIETYQLKTVTYGLSPASYMATRCLRELGLQYHGQFPGAAERIANDFYVDNLLTGSNCPVELTELKSQITLILADAGMSLKKWGANDEELLQNVADADRETSFNVDGDDFVKVLGLWWNADEDCFRIKVQPQHFSNKFTKRSIISDVAKVFDPLGLIAPVVTLAKIFMQRLWLLKIGWDEKLPANLQNDWMAYRSEIGDLKHLKMPRHLFGGCSNPINVQLHCFADASENAYGGCIYVRSRCNNVIICKLLCSKSRVAPKSKTIPKLELCAAELVAKMAAKYKSIVNYPVEDTYYWSDSTIVLHWINTSTEKLEVFVANRVRNIQQLTVSQSWRHVESKLNPADIVSRGMKPSSLMAAELWWNGPKYLMKDDGEWNRPFLPTQELFKQVAHVAASENEFHFFARLHHTNSFVTLQHTFGFVMRYLHNLRCGREGEKYSGRLTFAEVKAGHDALVHAVQLEAFGEDAQCANQSGHRIQNKCLRSLDAFKDGKGLLRVGGRLKFANIHYTAKHPLLLPTKHVVTKAIVNFIHNTHLHVGPQGLLAAVRQRYWPISGRKEVKAVVKDCVICSRAKPKMFQQFMGDLPNERVTQSHPFQVTGVDYCGPLYVYHNIRGKVPSKAYMAAFVCCVTRAVHLEVSSDMSAECFLGTLRRFIATRGLPVKIISDNGRNFIGANNQLRELAGLLMSTSFDDQIRDWCQQNQIEWKFAPPGSPHFGGIYEAAIKAAKFHLKRITHNARLTFEQMTTVAKQIESVLNSRPIVPMLSNDVVEVLTPGHFLIGRPLTSIPETPQVDEHLTYNQKWQQVVRIYKIFWSRWTAEYLCELQKRNYWQRKCPNIKVGMIVIMQDPNLPPLQWKFGKVVAIHPGKDDLVRVATIRTATGEFTRSVTKLAPLPTDVELQGNSRRGE